MLWLWHTANLSVPDLELLLPHGQLTIMLAEEIGAQIAVRVLSVSTDDNFLLVGASCCSYLYCCGA